jgi:hypothetical protein
MRKASAAAVVTILAISLYFTVMWGAEGVQVLTSPNYGLDDVWRSQTVFALGSLVGLAPLGLIKLSAFLGGVKLLAAAFCGLHVLKRLRVFASGGPDVEILEGALILVFAVSVVSAAAATWSYDPEMVGAQIINIVLVAIATALCAAERARSHAEQAVETELTEAAPHA